ncbi:hypothetical protein SAMN02745975_02650 [Geosporobacter subterraneus DSM 17957]|uniref:Uncharacterized protein n=1 Tax=Geosporobacter subterraneus DSM 17957 TaxID=1121919 RepID=A0A1M6LE11_9FIRM|nr:hypothetical protein [Geosporobacter subterraneus]SHJ69434.1 hypothetical protein SAMN02745975_02650 [Geosporobacter subterraneus DSM 17957]
MAEIFLIIIGIGYLIYKVAFGVPKDIKKLEDKVDLLKLHLQEIELKLNQIDKKLDRNE